MDLINSQQVPQEEVPQEEMPEAPDMGGNDMGASPESQQAYDSVVMAALKLLHSEQTASGFVQALQQRANEPAEALADTTALVIQEVDRQSQGKIPQEVILPAAGEVLSEVATIAEASGAFKADQQVVQEAVPMMMAKVAKLYGVDEAEAREFLDSPDVHGAIQSMAGA